MSNTQLVTIENLNVKDEENIEIKIVYFDNNDDLKKEILKCYIVRVAEMTNDTLTFYCKITDKKENENE